MYKVSIDRVGLVMPIVDKEMHGHLCGLLSGMKGEPGYKYWKTKYQTNAVVPLSAQETLRLQVGISHHHPYFRVDFNPAHLGTEEWDRFHAEFCCFLEHGYATLVAEAHVTYLEVAVDFAGLTWQGLLPFDSQLRNSCWYPDYWHPCPTGYLGRRGSNRVVRGYDKVARLISAGKPTTPGPTTRIEAVLRRVGCKVEGLLALPNPFSTVGVCDFSDAESQSTDSGWIQFLQHCKYEGASEAMQLLGSAKNKYLDRLKCVESDWWNPKEIWSLYPASLQALQGATGAH